MHVRSDRTGAIKVGDYLIKIQRTSTRALSHDQILLLLKNAGATFEVTLCTEQGVAHVRKRSKSKSAHTSKSSPRGATSNGSGAVPLAPSGSEVFVSAGDLLSHQKASLTEGGGSPWSRSDLSHQKASLTEGGGSPWSRSDKRTRRKGPVYGSTTSLRSNSTDYDDSYSDWETESNADSTYSLVILLVHHGHTPCTVLVRSLLFVQSIRPRQVPYHEPAVSIPPLTDVGA